MTYQQIQKSILELAKTAEGQSKIQEQRKQTMLLSDAVKGINERAYAEPRKRAVAEITFRVDKVEEVQGEQRPLSVSVETIAQRRKRVLGSIQFDNATPIFYFNPRVGSLFYGTATGSARPLEWSGAIDIDSHEMQRIMEEATYIITNEKRTLKRKIYWDLVARLGLGGAHDVLAGLQPALIAGYPAAVQTWISADGKPETSSIDVVACNTGSLGDPFLVFELKRPGEDSPAIALEQAIRYAMAMDLEANDNQKATQTKYRTLLGSKGDARLRFGAVAVVEGTEQNQSLAKAALADFKAPASGDAVSACAHTVSVLFYDWDQEKNQATNWRWLEGSDPR